MPMLRAFPVVLLLLAACDPGSSPASVTQPDFLVVGGGDECLYSYESTGIRPPINADGSSSFNSARTIPVKIRFTACEGGAPADQLVPTLTLERLGDGGRPVNEVVSSSAADDGVTMRPAGDGQYIFNLSTKRSQFNHGEDLTPGSYRLTIQGNGDFEDVEVEFSLR